MDGDGQNDPEGKLFCRFGCGYYGNPATDGLCSVCYKLTAASNKETKDATNNAIKATECIAEADKNISNENHELTKSQGEQLKQPEMKEHERNEQQPPPDPGPSSSSKAPGATDPNATTTGTAPNATDHATTSTEAAANNEGNINNESENVEKKKNRCAKCGKKIGLTGFECRCGLMFCAVHRYSDAHDCTFNYREMGAEQIRRDNPQVIKEKIRKI